jgi:hypothetical protein
MQGALTGNSNIHDSAGYLPAKKKSQPSKSTLEPFNPAGRGSPDGHLFFGFFLNKNSLLAARKSSRGLP